MPFVAQINPAVDDGRRGERALLELRLEITLSSGSALKRVAIPVLSITSIFPSPITGELK